MNKEGLTIADLQYWQKRLEEAKKEGLTKVKWCSLGHEIMEKYDMTEKEAVMILHGKNPF